MTPQIIPCPVGFGKDATDLERTPELIERMRAMGLPMSDFIMGQPDFTKRDAKQLRAAQSNPDDLEEARRIRDYIGNQIAKYQAINPTHWYVNHEYDDHSGLEAIINPQDAKLTAQWYRMLQDKFPHSPGSVYNALGVYASTPITTQTSIDSFKLLDRECHMDWLYANGYIKGFPTPQEITLKNTQVITQCRNLAQGRPVMLAFQTRRRFLASNSVGPLTNEDVSAWWLSATTLDVGYVILYLPLGINGSEFDQRIAELEAQTPIINAAIESVRIK